MKLIIAILFFALQAVVMAALVEPNTTGRTTNGPVVAPDKPHNATFKLLSDNSGNLVQWQINAHRHFEFFEIRRSINGNRDETFRLRASDVQRQEIQGHEVAFFWIDTNNVALPGPGVTLSYAYKVRVFNKTGDASPWAKAIKQ